MVHNIQYQYHATNCLFCLEARLLYRLLCQQCFTFIFEEESILSSAEDVVSFGPMRNPEITERLYESLRLLQTSKECMFELVKVP